MSDPEPTEEWQRELERRGAVQLDLREPEHRPLVEAVGKENLVALLRLPEPPAVFAIHRELSTESQHTNPSGLKPTVIHRYLRARLDFPPAAGVDRHVGVALTMREGIRSNFRTSGPLMKVLLVFLALGVGPLFAALLLLAEVVGFARGVRRVRLGGEVDRVFQVNTTAPEQVPTEALKQWLTPFSKRPPFTAVEVKHGFLTVKGLGVRDNLARFVDALQHAGS